MNRLLTRWARDNIGRRGAALLFFAFLDFIYAYSLFNPAPEVRRTATVLFVEGLLPLWVWGAMWLAAGICCLTNAFRANDKVGFAAAIAIKTLWGLLFVVAMVAGLERAYVSAALWLVLAGWVGIIATWPESTGRR